MSSILVVRGAGDKQGQDVYEVLLTDDAAKLARGRTELDSNAHGLEPVDLVVLYRPGVELGQVCHVVDATQGADYYAKISSIEYVYRNNESNLRLTVMRPTNFNEPL